MSTNNNREPAPAGQGEQQHPAFPQISRPAQRALANAGYTHLGQLTTASEREIARLHGMGPKALGQLREALAAHGLSFAGE